MLPPDAAKTSLPSATELARLLGSRAISSREAVLACLRRIDEREPAVHAFTSVFRERALSDADALDTERARGRVRGPLHGLPVSIKENFDFAGEASTMGVPSRRALKAPADAAMVTLLREAGAVILGRTNLSQLMLYAESRNPVFGQTANPWSAAHGPGGSSGGEAAAIAAGMSPLGVGTDIGGSIRVPAHFCGIAGLKPTLDRLPMRGAASGIPGQEAVRAQCGPMARTVADLSLFMSALDPLRMSALDGRVPPLAFAAQPLGKPRVGLCIDDGVVPPSLAVVRGLERAARALRDRGCEIVPFAPPRVREAIFLQLQAMSADGGAAIGKLLRGQPVDPVLLSLMRIARLPGPVRGVLARAVRDELPARTLRALGRKPVEELWRLTGELRAYRFEMLAAWDAAGIDLLLCPPFATPALPHLGAKSFVLAASASMLWNITQLPAGVVPVTRVRADETERAPAPGIPVGAQIVGRPWAEPLVLAAMEAIEMEVRGDADFPGTPV
jgi:fatty acid amide hydrolase